MNKIYSWNENESEESSGRKFLINDLLLFNFAVLGGGTGSVGSPISMLFITIIWNLKKVKIDYQVIVW